MEIKLKSVLTEIEVITTTGNKYNCVYDRQLNEDGTSDCELSVYNDGAIEPIFKIDYSGITYEDIQELITQIDWNQDFNTNVTKTEKTPDN